MMKIDQLLKNEDLLYSVLWQMMPHVNRQRGKRVSVLMMMVRMWVFYKKPIFPSAKWLAAYGRCDEKTVDRLVAWLRERGLIRTKRRFNDGWLGTNEIDLAPLVGQLTRLLGRLLKLTAKRTRIYVQETGLLLKAWFWPSKKKGVPTPPPVENFMTVAFGP